MTGDQSVDHEWYLKRLALAKVIVKTELYMSMDTSENYQGKFYALILSSFG
jgi:ubiquinone biosynthesis protein COQ9